MNKLFSKSKFILLCIMISACQVNIMEEIYLNKDGSGEYLIYTDMISNSRETTLKLMSNLSPDLDGDSLIEMVDDLLWQEFPSENVDSLINISNQLSDDKKQDPNKMKIIDRMSGFLRGSRKEGYLHTGLKFRFDDVEQLANLHDFVFENQDSYEEFGLSSIKTQKVNIEYQYDGNTFSRKVLLANKSPMSDSASDEINAFWGESTLQTILHLPRNSRSASKERLIHAKGKVVRYKYPLTEYSYNPEIFTFSIKMR